MNDPILKTLIARLSVPHWMAQDPLNCLAQSAGNLGEINIYWVLTGRGVIDKTFFEKNLETWFRVSALADERIDNIPVKEYATLFNQKEFYEFVCKHPTVFEEHFSRQVWKKAFTAKVVGIA